MRSLTESAESREHRPTDNECEADSDLCGGVDERLMSISEVRQQRSN